jgi:hypothetical protein
MLLIVDMVNRALPFSAPSKTSIYLTAQYVWLF